MSAPGPTLTTWCCAINRQLCGVHRSWRHVVVFRQQSTVLGHEMLVAEAEFDDHLLLHVFRRWRCRPDNIIEKDSSNPAVAGATVNPAVRAS